MMIISKIAQSKEQTTRQMNFFKQIAKLCFEAEIFEKNDANKITQLILSSFLQTFWPFLVVTSVNFLISNCCRVYSTEIGKNEQTSAISECVRTSQQ
jgi:hypothetical protein